MKKLFLIGCMVAAAYRGAGQIKVGPEAGLNISNYSFSHPQRAYTSSPMPGVRLGVVADLALLGDRCYLQPGVMYVGNGATVNEPGYTISTRQSFRVHTIEVPFNLLYKFGNADRSRFFVGAGLYLGMNISDEVFYISNYDMGAGLNAGFESGGGLFVRVTSQWGVLRPKPSDISVGSSNYALTLGYFFKRNRTSGKLLEDSIN